MSDFFKDAIVCFENATRAIMAEQALIENKFPVRVMPLPSSIREGCGFCLRFSPEDLERAALFLSEQGFTIADAYLREETPEAVSYKKISLAKGGRDAAKL